MTVDATLGGQLLLWEFATAVAGRIIGINPFDQPDVESAKAAAREMLEGGGDQPRPMFVDGTTTVYASEGWLPKGTDTVADAVAALLEHIDDEHGYLAVQAYLDRHRDAALAEVRARSRASYRPAGHVRLGTALPALDRAVPQGRAGHRCLPAGHGPAARPTSRCPTDPSRSTSS